MQRNLFLKPVHDQSLLPVISSYLKLYSTIDMDKLVRLLENKVDKETLKSLLLALSHKSNQLKWSNGIPPLEGAWGPATNLEFWVEGVCFFLYQFVSFF